MSCVLRMDSIHKELIVLQHMLERSEKPSNISLSILKYITNDFSEELKIGRGGCGEVYKVNLIFILHLPLKFLCST